MRLSMLIGIATDAFDVCALHTLWRLHVCSDNEQLALIGAPHSESHIRLLAHQRNRKVKHTMKSPPRQGGIGG